MKNLVAPMDVGSAVGAFVGGLLLPFVSAAALKAVLGLILLIPACKTFAR